MEKETVDSKVSLSASHQKSGHSKQSKHDSLDTEYLEASIQRMERELQCQRIRLLKARSLERFLLFCHITSSQAELWLRNLNQPEVFLLDSAEDGTEKSYFALLQFREGKEQPYNASYLSLNKAFHTDAMMDMEWRWDRDEIRNALSEKIDDTDVVADLFDIISLETVLDDSHFETIVSCTKSLRYTNPLHILFLRFCYVLTKYIENQDDIDLGCTNCPCAFHYRDYWNFSCLNLK